MVALDLGQSPQDFLFHYWQRQPVVIEGALSDLPEIDKDALFALALQDDVESRLVIEKGGDYPWQVLHGPLTSGQLDALPKTHWTLLVSKVNELQAGFAELLNCFAFIPNWRIDDIMVSVSAPSGGVGAHIDSYDVFLIQARGHRQWQLQTKPKPETIDGLDLQILKKFKPDQEWQLTAGDVLYVPPGVAHKGVALDEGFTYSVGFRAPSDFDLLATFFEDALATMKKGGRYSDPDLLGMQEPGIIDRQALYRVMSVIQNIPLSEEYISRWFGQYITRPERVANEKSNGARGFKTWRKVGVAQRSRSSRLSYIELGEQLFLYADGEEFSLPAASRRALSLLTSQLEITYSDFAPFLQEKTFAQVIEELFAKGVLRVVK